MKFKPEKIKKILCIKPRGIGDIILSTIILDNLIAYFPSAKIDYLTEEFAKHAVENNPLVNKVLTMKKTDLSIKTAFKIRKEKYDLILDMWSNPWTAQITFFSGVKYRAGFAYRGRKYAYNIHATSERGEHHSAEHNLELLRALNIPIISKHVYYFVSEKEDMLGKNFIEKNVPHGYSIMGIIPSGGWPSKRCDKEKWVEIIKTVSEKYRTKFIILWGPGDETDADFITSRLPEQTIIAPKTDIPAMAGIIKNCSLIIANDSGPMHLAAAMGIPTIGLFGPTNPQMHRPYSENSAYVINKDLFCIVCNFTECPYKHECFTKLPVETVLDKIDYLIGKSRIKIIKNEKA